ncbi:MAG: rod shape-determining protein MreC [Ruminococcaceae bacterium]|nr:rod shape-determining protein MreC [Oscillospiraceae bacterium]
MKKLFGNRIFVLILSITVSLSVILGVVNATKTKSTIMANIAMVTITPIQNACSWIGQKVGGFFGYFDDMDEIKSENEKIKTENRKLEIDKQRIEKVTKENEELRSMLLLKEAYPELELTAAEIVSRSASNWYEGFVIDKGSTDGLKIGQGVVTADNVLVGRISDIGSTWARVTAITDAEHNAGAVIVRSGDMGVIEGDAALGKDGKCKLSFISKNNDIVVGDYLETSGLGGVYPKGIEIGKVVEIKSEIEGISQYAVVEISVDIERISKVMVVRNTIEEPGK